MLAHYVAAAAVRGDCTARSARRWPEARSVQHSVVKLCVQVDGVAVVDRGVEDGDSRFGQCVFEGVFEFVHAGDPNPGGAECRSVVGDVVATQCHSGLAPVFHDFLERHHVVGVVAEDDVGEAQPEPSGGLQFLCAEKESAVTGYRHHLGAGAHHRGGHAPWQRNTKSLLSVGEQSRRGW